MNVRYDLATSNAPSSGSERPAATATPYAEADMHEYAVVLSNGMVFYTSGWETWVSLDRAIRQHQGVAGTFDPVQEHNVVVQNTTGTYYDTHIDPEKVVAIIDLREEAA